MKTTPLFMRRPKNHGFSLVELMVALVLGLLVVGAAIAIFAANRQAYRSGEGLGRVQENLRIAFELMARDIREAGGNPCVRDVVTVNVLNGSTSQWYTDLNDWSRIVVGYDNAVAFPNGSPAFGTATGNRISGTDAIQLLSGGTKVATVEAHDTATSTFTLNRNDAGFSAGDLIVACNSSQASVFQASSASSDQVGHAAGGTPGNCDGTLGLVACTDTVFEYSPPASVLTDLHASRWYVGRNANGGNSLYQSALQNNAGTPVVINQEVLEGVQNMQITYLSSGAASYVPAASVGDWGQVVSVRIVLTLTSMENVGTDGNPIERQLIQTVSLRNRNA